MNGKRIKKDKKSTLNIIIITIIIITIIAIVIFAITRNNNISIRENMLNQFKKDIEQMNTDNENSIEEQSKSVEEIIVTPTEEEAKQSKDSIDNYKTIGILKIPSLNIEYPIISETTNAALKISVTKYWGPNPNEVGNLVILGHNYKSSYMLSKLPNIKIGDIIKITDKKGKTIDYKVYETKKIDPYDSSCTSQKTDGKKEVTVITCVDNGKNRFYAKAREK